eukprot:COSAG02_NODE_5561_length_4228_cov_309.315331_5_plen_46_part_00
MLLLCVWGVCPPGEVVVRGAGLWGAGGGDDGVREYCVEEGAGLVA